MTDYQSEFREAQKQLREILRLAQYGGDIRGTRDQTNMMTLAQIEGTLEAWFDLHPEVSDG